MGYLSSLSPCRSLFFYYHRIHTSQVHAHACGAVDVANHEKMLPCVRPRALFLCATLAGLRFGERDSSGSHGRTHLRDGERHEQVSLHYCCACIHKKE